ncbi:MAG: PAS domain S-box protein, partial [Dehalococcoidales bacterium]|nr:PAS domain S-box protein [Dehalococcoidales bacterium]
EDKISHLASFPELNPNPVLEMYLTGRVTYANPAAQLDFPDLATRNGEHPYLAGFHLITAELKKGNTASITREVTVGDSCHLQTFQYIKEKGLIRIYGRDITGRKQAETALASYRDRLEELVKKRTTELVKTNINLKKESAVRAHAEVRASVAEASFRSAIASNIDGMVITDKEDRVLFANPAAERMLRDGKEMVGSFFDYPVSMGKVREIDIRRDDGTTIAAEIRTVPTRWEDRDACLTMLRDITQRRENERKDRVQQDLYKLFLEAPSQQDYLQKAAELLREFTGCRCIGIRSLDENDNIPYLVHIGFSPEFVTQENCLSLKSDQCACVRIISGNAEPQDAPAMTPGESFCCNDTASFIRNMTTEQATRFRGTCLKAGFQTLGIVPIRYAGNTIGAIHIADKRPGMLPEPVIQFIESIAPLIGEAVKRFRIEQELRENQLRLSEAERIGHLGNWVWDIESNRLTWSEEVYRIFGRTPEQDQPHTFEVTFDMFLGYIHPDDREAVTQTLTEVLEEGKPYDIEHRVILPDGSVRMVHEKGIVICNEVGKPVRMIGTVHDITEHKNTEEELRALSNRIVETQENERRSIAREMHDVLGQSLTVLKLLLDKASHAPPEEVKPTLQKAQETINEVVQRVRNISLELRPSMLDDLGLLPTLLWYCDRYSSQTKLHIQFNHDGLDRDFPVTVSTAAFRIVQEALTNATRYAMVDEVAINAWTDKKNLYITIKDRGTGFDPAQLVSGTTSGLSGMKERALALGGKLSVESSPGAGTTITAELPLAQRRKAGKKKPTR